MSDTLHHDNVEKKIHQALPAALEYLYRHQAAARMIGSIAAAAVLTMAVIYGPRTPSERQLAATTEMERLAGRLERIKHVPPETASLIARIINQPDHDCTQVSCRPAIEIRNRAARARLLALLKAEMPDQSSGPSSASEPGEAVGLKPLSDP